MHADLESLFGKLQVERDNVIALVAGLSDEQLDKPGANGCWSVRQTLAHMVSSEPWLLAMGRNIVDGAQALPDVSLHETNAREVSQREGLSIAALLAEWQTRREEWRAFLETLSPEQLELQGPHPAFNQLVTLRQMVIVMLKHERNHRQDMLDALAQP